MTLHIYQARLLHYIVQNKANSNQPIANNLNANKTSLSKQAHSKTGTVDDSITDDPILIMPINKGDVIRPEYIENGALVIDDHTGLIVDYGESTSILGYYQFNKLFANDIEIHDLSDKLIMPGFIDTHVHYPQLDMIAAYGKQLLDWLNNYTFVTEAKFNCSDYAEAKADFFLNQLLANGTTSAMVFATSHLISAQAFFKQSAQLGTRMICGNVLMDQNAPESLCVNSEQGIKDTQTLIDEWQGNARQLVAITPRFAITSSPKQLKLTGQLYTQNKGVYLQTHLAENKEEVIAVQKMYPEYNGYLDVYDKMGLLGRMTTLAHGIYLNDHEYQRLQQTGTQIAHCPTSNLFLGSGLFDLTRTLGHTGVSIATDVGAGTSLSLLATLSECYKIQQLQGNQLSAHQGFYQITLGNAQSLQLESMIGNFSIGSEADFVVIDTKATALLQQRQSQTKSLEEELFVLMMLGDDRVIEYTFISGLCRYQRNL